MSLSYKQQVGRAMRPQMANRENLINWAELYGVVPIVSQTYCGSIKEQNRLPRGSRECISALRFSLLSRARGRFTNKVLTVKELIDSGHLTDYKIPVSTPTNILHSHFDKLGHNS